MQACCSVVFYVVATESVNVGLDKTWVQFYLFFCLFSLMWSWEAVNNIEFDNQTLICHHKWIIGIYIMHTKNGYIGYILLRTPQMWNWSIFTVWQKYCWKKQHSFTFGQIFLYIKVMICKWFSPGMLLRAGYWLKEILSLAKISASVSVGVCYPKVELQKLRGEEDDSGN